jgi:hypothetical protein
VTQMLLLPNGDVHPTQEWRDLDDEEKVKLIATWVKGLMEEVLSTSIQPTETSAPGTEAVE